MPGRALQLRWRALVRAFVTFFLYDVFISYARRDGRRYARALHRHLEHRGVVCFLDRSDILAGDPLSPTLAKALKKSRLLIVVATRGASLSQHVQLEVETYLTTRRPVVPIDFGGSYSQGTWPLLIPRNLVWLDEPPGALASRPSPEVLRGIRQHLNAAGSRVLAQRVAAIIVLVVVALGGGVWWSMRRAADQALQREAEQLSARAGLAFDIDQNPLRALAYGVAALSRHESVEAVQVLGRVLPFARRALQGHKIGRFASRVTYSPRGKYLLAVGRLDTPFDVLTILTANGVEEVWRKERPHFSAEAISPDERLLVVADGGACVAVVEIASGRTLSCLAHAGVTAAEFAADGRRLMTTGQWSADRSGSTPSVALWESDRWSSVSELPLQTGIWSSTIRADGAYIALGLQAREVGAPIACVWQPAASARCRAVASLDEPLKSGRLWASADVQFSPDGQQLLVAEPTRLTLLDVVSGDERQRLVDSVGFGHVVFDPSGGALLSAGAAGLATLFPTTRRSFATFIAQLQHPSRILATQFTSDGRTIITACDDGIVRLWDAGLEPADSNDFSRSTRLAGITMHGANLTPFVRSRGQTVNAISAAPDGRSFATAASDGWVRVWSVEPEPEVDWSRHGQSVTAIAATQDGTSFITASEFAGRIWELDPLRAVARLRRHGNDLTGAGVSRDGRIMITADSEGAVFVFDGQTLNFLRDIVHHPGSESVVRAALSADGGTIATTSADQTVRVWRSHDGTIVSERHFEAKIDALALNAEGDAVAIASGRTAAVWQIDRDWSERVHIAADSPVRTVQFRDTYLATGSEDGMVSLWNAATGRRIFSGLQAGRVNSVDMSADGRLVLSGGDDRTVRVWNLSNGTEQTRLTFPFRVSAVKFLRDATRIAAAGENYVQVSPWRMSDLRDLACRHLASIDAGSWASLVGDVDSHICH